MKDYDILKRYYGENFAKMCRSFFPTILEKEGLLSEIILSKFEPSKFLYEDLVLNQCLGGFKDYINSFVEDEKIEELGIDETPQQLFDKAGYTLYKCETNEDIHMFKKYYDGAEEICTFRDPYRIETHIIFFAVKKDVDKIRREDFSKPNRQDLYGTSVISIQFTKGSRCSLSIKNRYNHKVDNPDSTFSNNLENIYPGLTESFKKYYGIKQSKGRGEFTLPNYILANNGKYYRYNYKISGEYFCANNVIVDFDKNAIKLNSDREELIDYFIFDKQKKIITSILNDYHDAFENCVQNIDKIEMRKIDNGQKQVDILLKNGEKTQLIVDKYNRIIGFTNNDIKEIGNNFLSYNTGLMQFNASNLNSVGDYFLNDNNALENFNAENLKKIGSNALLKNEAITNLNIPNVESIGSYFLYNNRNIKQLNVPNLKFADNWCLFYSKNLERIYAPNLLKVGDFTFGYGVNLKEFYAPKLDAKNLTYGIKRVLKRGKSLSLFRKLGLKKNNKMNEKSENCLNI